MPLQTNDALGPYQVGERIGEGGMGAIYRARDTRLGRDVAIKVLTNVAVNDHERLIRFEQEARTIGMLNHPNLLTVYDVGRDAEDNPYLVTELLEGEALSGRLARGPLSPRKAVDAALQMAHGLAAAHEKGIVHRDLKPDNIFLNRDGRLKILDFGIAKLTGPASDDGPVFQSAATEPGMVLGTVGYMSPEQVRGEPVDQRSDIFSFGAIVFEMLTGTRAFKRNSAIETLSAILKEDPPDLTELLPGVPPTLERLVRRCLEKDRALRFQTARDLAFNLETLAQMASSQTLSSVVRPSVTASRPADASTTAQTAQRTAIPAPAAPTARQTAMRPVTKPKRRASPILVALLFLVSLIGAAYAGWLWAKRNAETRIEPRYARLTFRRGEVRSARFSPDGDTIIYSAAWEGKAPEVFVVPRGATEARPLGLTDTEVLSVSRSSELAVLLRRSRVTGLGTLARVPLAGGVPREVATNVMQADWAPDGASLAIVRRLADKTIVEFPIGTALYETQRFVNNVRVAPDGKRLAILEPSRGEFEIAVIEGRAQPVTIARGWGRGVTGLAWSPDGREIWVSGTGDGGPPALYAVDAEDGAVRLITRLTGAIRIFDLSPRNEALLANATWRAALLWNDGTASPSAPAANEPATPAIANGASTAPATTTGTVATATTTAPTTATSTAMSAAPAAASDAMTPATAPLVADRDVSWLDWSVLADLSRDGKTILFSETREGGGLKSAMYLRRAADSAPLHLGEGVGDALSPDGMWVLSHQGAKLVLVPTGAGQPRELTVEGAYENGAAWLRDSRRAVVGGVAGKDGYRLYLLDTLDETIKPVSPQNIWSNGTRAYALSPDDTLVAGMNAEQTISLYPLAGGAGRKVDGAMKGEIPIQWTEDGSALYVHDPDQMPSRVHRIDLASGTRTLWRAFAPSDPAGVYKIAPVLVTPDGNAWAYTAMRMLSDLYVVEGLR